MGTHGFDNIIPAYNEQETWQNTPDGADGTIMK